MWSTLLQHHQHERHSEIVKREISEFNLQSQENPYYYDETFNKGRHPTNKEKTVCQHPISFSYKYVRKRTLHIVALNTL